MLASLWHHFVLFGTNLHYIWCEFSMIITTRSAPSKSAIFDKSGEQHEHQSLKENTIFYWTYLVQKRCRFNALFNFEVDPHSSYNPQKLIFIHIHSDKQLKLYNRSTKSADPLRNTVNVFQSPFLSMQLK